MDSEQEKNEKDKEVVLPRAYYALIVLTILNFVNYLDRYIPAANKDLIKVTLEYEI